MAVTRRRRSRTTEVGVAGNRDHDGFVGDDYLDVLDGESGRAIYDRMRRSDGTIGLTLENIGLPIRGADYRMEPASDSAQDVEIAEFIEAALLENMTHTWDDALRHALLMLDFGFSILEKVWIFVDGMWTIKKLAPRLPQSVTRWQYGPDRNLLGPVQTSEDGGDEILLPVEKLLIFTRAKEGDNWEGISVLRRLYKGWFIKEDAEKVNAISIDRFGAGVPVMHVPASVKLGDSEYADTERMLEAFHSNEVGFIIEPEGYVFRIEGAGTENSGVDPLPTIKHYDEDAAKAMLQAFVNLGTSQTGSRSLGASFIKFFQQAEQATANYIVDIVNRFLIKEWVGLNWEGVTGLPRLTVSRLEELSIEALAQLSSAGLLTPDLELEQAIRVEQHLPAKEEEEDEDEDEVEEPDTDDEEEEDDPPPDEDDMERAAVEEAVSAALPQLVKLQSAQAYALVSTLLDGRPIPEIKVPHKREVFEQLSEAMLGGVYHDTDTDVLTLVVEEMATDIKLVMARAYNLLRRRSLAGEALRYKLDAVARKLPHEQLIRESARMAMMKGNVLELVS